MRRFGLALLFMLCTAFGALAEIDDLKPSGTVAAPAPAGMTQQQFDSLVKAVTDAVTKALQDKQAPQTHPLITETDQDRSAFARKLAVMVERFPAVIAGIPGMFHALERMATRLDRSAQNGMSLGEFLIVLFATLLASWLIESAIRIFARKTAQKLAAKVPEPKGLRALLGLSLIDAVRIVAVATVFHFTLAVWFTQPGFQATFMALALDGWLRWRIFMAIAEMIVRPTLPPARIAPISNASAKQLMFWLSVTVAIVSFARFYASLFATPSVLAAALMVNAFVVTGIYIAFLSACRTPLSEWFSGLVEKGKRSSGWKLGIARHWFALAIPLLLFAAVTRLFGALTANNAIPAASAATLNVIIGYILFETLMAFIARRTTELGTTSEHLKPFMLRALHVVAIITVVLWILNIWTVNGLNLLEQSQWSEILESWRSLGLILLGGFFAWEAVRFISTHYSARTISGLSNEDTLEAPTGATRLQTLMPPFRVAMGVTIAVTTLLMALSSLGINTTPLIAGASVIGLAVSFGSQALVKDVVSGIFFLADDAFRVGEYIDCKSVKGTVEGFTLRSIKLRHQNGQIHTLPFGQLGQITNFSRDWSTVKFNLRFARDTDVDALRKATKKLGQELAEDPELKDQFIAPLKLQGVADIDDNSLIMRFKFTVKPINPAFVQRQAVKRMIADFPALGLKFASTPGLILQAPYPLEPNQATMNGERTQVKPAPAEKPATPAETI